MYLSPPLVIKTVQMQFLQNCIGDLKIPDRILLYLLWLEVMTDKVNMMVMSD